MREYKFRGKSEKTNEWVYGYLVDERHISEKNELGYTPIKKETIGQYTGLKDKSGVEIYEGDIVHLFGGQYEQGFYEYDDIGVVKDLIKDGHGLSICLDQGINSKIIGNIYDNSKLLESGDINE